MTYGEYSRDPHRLGYDMSLFIGQSQPKPSVVLLKDSLILTEVFGADFTKAPGGKVSLPVMHPRHLLIVECSFEPVLRTSVPADDKSLS